MLGLGQNRVITNDVNSCSYCYYVRYVILICNILAQTGANQYHPQLGLQDKGCATKGLVVCNNRDLEPLDLQNGLALGCYQPSPEVLILS